MTQYFRNDDDTKKIHSVFEQAKKTNNVSLKLMHENIIGSYALGKAILDSGIVDFGFKVDEEYFVQNYVAILEAMQKAGILDTYVILIKRLLGAGVDVQFTMPNPGHLQLNVQEVESRARALVNRDKKYIMAKTSSGLKAIVVKQRITEYSLSQAIKVIQNITPAGIFIEVGFLSETV